MSDALLDLRRREVEVNVAGEIKAFSAELAERREAGAVLFYGSNLRTGELSGVLDFYVLTRRPHRRGLRGWVERWLWPEIGFERFEVDGRELRAKVATLPLSVFRRAAGGRTLDTTIWTRFVQPCALVYAADGSVAGEVVEALAAAAVTASRFAVLLGPPRGRAEDYWAALFQATYAAEFRVEAPGRERQVIAHHPDRYAALLPVAWEAAGVGFTREGKTLFPRLSDPARAQLRRAWRLRRGFGKPLNVARLIKAAFVTEGAGRYAAWKLERHTGVAVEVTPWRERHPILSAPLVLWRARRRQAEARRAGRSSSP